MNSVAKDSETMLPSAAVAAVGAVAAAAAAAAMEETEVAGEAAAAAAAEREGEEEVAMVGEAATKEVSEAGDAGDAELVLEDGVPAEAKMSGWTAAAKPWSSVIICWRRSGAANVCIGSDAIENVLATFFCALDVLFLLTFPLSGEDSESREGVGVWKPCAKTCE